MSSPEHKQLIWNLIKEVKVGMLITEDNDTKASLHGRPMSLVQDAYDGTLFFYTHKDAGKVYEVANEKKEVCITFADPSDQVYVSLSGHAKITHDQKLIDKYWSAGVSAWFPEGKEGGNVAMLEVKIYKGEHWNTDENKLIQLFEFTKAQINDETPEIGEHEKFDATK